MATDKTTTPNAPLHSSVPDELIVEVCPDYWAQYKGTRAQLEAEGVIPKDIEWPTRTLKTSWDVDGVNFCLSRIRPDGMKGPMKLWVEGDYWSLYFYVPAQDWRWKAQKSIERKAEELRLAIYWQSAEGRSENMRNLDRILAVRGDKTFQAFKNSLLPERKKLGRKPKLAGFSQKASA